MEKIKFSIAIPAYKAEYLRECIESCLSQTYNNFEIVVVDDASPENLSEIIQVFNDSRIKYFRNKKNCGALNVVDNWNICLSYCTGDYIICIGDDDKLLPNSLFDYSNLIQKYPDIGILHGWTEIIDENSQHIVLTEPRPEYESLYSMIWNRWDNRKQQFIGDWCFNRKWLSSKGGFYKLPYAWGSDDISAVIGASKNGVANTQTICFQYRVNSQTITKTGAISGKLKAIQLEKQWYLIFLSKVPSNEVDKLYRLDIIKILPSYFEKKYGYYLSQKIKHNAFFLVNCIFLKRKYGFSNKAIGYAIYLALH